MRTKRQLKLHRIEPGFPADLPAGAQIVWFLPAPDAQAIHVLVDTKPPATIAPPPMCEHDPYFQIDPNVAYLDGRVGV